MEIEQEAAEYVFAELERQGIYPEFISDSGTVDKLINDGWTYTEIVQGEADDFIQDHICWLD